MWKFNSLQPVPKIVHKKLNWAMKILNRWTNKETIILKRTINEQQFQLTMNLR